jgi:cellulose synthase/poly-beta-1,6-N-acetylglucosamine synthase-like glycosyltransferase
MIDTLTAVIFWISVIGILYAYFGYPLILYLITKLRKKNHIKTISVEEYLPRVSIIIPFHNEENNLPQKIQNLLDLDYPADHLEFVLVSDGSTDRSLKIIQSQNANTIRLFGLNSRQGKAAALNLGLQNVNSEIIVFTDASIMLEKNALNQIVKGFQDQQIGCVSGEDYIPDSSGEGVYGRYELWLRNLESLFSSIVGASGSFYAQRRELVTEFLPGMAPDFLSVLNTVEKGYRAITEPAARGAMKSVKKSSHEFSRKVRTLIRGMTALFYKKNLLNIFKYPGFAFSLFSHKIIRWLVPWFMIVALLANFFLINQSGFYQVIFYLQLLFYGLSVIAALKGLQIHQTLPGKICLYFTISNLAILLAWIKYWRRDYQEIWQPSLRN